MLPLSFCPLFLYDFSVKAFKKNHSFAFFSWTPSSFLTLSSESVSKHLQSPIFTYLLVLLYLPPSLSSTIISTPFPSFPLRPFPSLLSPSDRVSMYLLSDPLSHLHLSPSSSISPSFSSSLPVYTDSLIVKLTSLSLPSLSPYPIVSMYLLSPIFTYLLVTLYLPSSLSLSLCLPPLSSAVARTLLAPFISPPTSLPFVPRLFPNDGFASYSLVEIRRF